MKRIARALDEYNFVKQKTTILPTIKLSQTNIKETLSKAQRIRGLSSYTGLYQISFSESRFSINFKISPELQHQNLYQTLCSTSEQKLSFMTKPHLPNLQQTVANTILIINISNSGSKLVRSTRFEQTCPVSL